MFQVIILVISLVILPPSVSQYMPIKTINHVELLCNQQEEGFLIPLSFNLIILLVCAMHGFLIRKLPENFNESWYIFISVSTTLFMWMVFLPTYVTTFYAYHQVVLLSFCLILNGFITLLTLYVPKLYAIYFVSEEMVVFGLSQASSNATQVVPDGIRRL